MAINKEIPYAYRRDVPFNLELDDYGDLKMLEDSAAVSQSIYTILMSNFGNKPMEYIFGSNMEQMIFEQGSPEAFIKFEVEQRIRDAITKDEPNIRILDINVDITNINNYTIHVTMEFALADGITVGVFDEDLAFVDLNR